MKSEINDDNVINSFFIEKLLIIHISDFHIFQLINPFYLKLFTDLDLEL